MAVPGAARGRGRIACCGRQASVRPGDDMQREIDVTDMDTAAGEGLRRRRTGGRAGHERHAAAPAAAVGAAAHALRPTEVISADELESIHVASLRVLSEIGMDFLDPDAREVLQAAGAQVEPTRSACASTRTWSPSRSRRRPRRSRCTRGTPRTTSSSVATGWRSGRSAVRRTSRTSTAAGARQPRGLPEPAAPRADAERDPFPRPAIRSSRSTYTTASATCTRPTTP